MNGLPVWPGWRDPRRMQRPDPTRTPAAPVLGDELRTVRQGYCGLVLLSAALQLLYFGQAESNALTTLLALASSWIGISFACNSERFRTHPVSALILLLYTTTATSGALLVKTLEWSPLADRLQMPVTTFAVLFAIQLSILAADHVYMRSAAASSVRSFVSNRMLKPIGLMQWPSDAQLWMLGGMGCVSVLLTGTDFESDASFGLASAGSKVIRAFGFLKFAPFLIPFRDALSGVPSQNRVPTLPLVGYFGLLVVISFATNSRSTFADAIPTVAICLLIGQALGRVNLRRIPPHQLILFAIGALLAGLLLSRVALAMVVVRDYRHNADVGMLVKMTIEALFNSEWLEGARAKMETAVSVANYSETYVDSRFLARFLLTKFHDNIIYYFSLAGADQIASYKEFMLDRLAATLPDPLLRAIGASINKQDLVVSNGDYLIYLVDGWGLGGFKTGSMLGEVYAVAGWAFPAVMFVCALVLFVFHDAFVVESSNRRLAFSPLILLLIWNLCGTTAAFGLGSETITAIPAGIARGLPQNVVIYLLAIMIVRAVSKITGRGA